MAYEIEQRDLGTLDETSFGVLNINPNAGLRRGPSINHSVTIYDASSVGTEYLPSDLDGNSQFRIEISFQPDLQPQCLGSPNLDLSMRSTIHGAGSNLLESLSLHELHSPGLRAGSEPVRRLSLLSFQPWLSTLLLRDDTRSLDTADWSWSNNAALDHDEVPQSIRLLVRNKFADEVSLSSSDDDGFVSADDSRLTSTIRTNGPRQPQLEPVPGLLEPKMAECFSSSGAQISHENVLDSFSDSAPSYRRSDSFSPLVTRNFELPGHRRVKRSRPANREKESLSSEAGPSSETVHLSEFSPLTRCRDAASRRTLLYTDQVHTGATRLGARAVSPQELLATVSRPESRQTTHQSVSDSDATHLTPLFSSSSATMPSTNISTPRSSIYEGAIEDFRQTHQSPGSNTPYDSSRFSVTLHDPHAPTQARGPSPRVWLKSSPQSSSRLTAPLPKSKLSKEQFAASKGREETDNEDDGEGADEVEALSGNSSPTLGPLAVFNQLVRSLSKTSSHSWRSQTRRSMDRSSTASATGDDQVEETKGGEGESEAGAEGVRENIPSS